MMKRILFISICFLYISSDIYSQQLANWSTFYENGFIWNPALTAKWNYWELSTTHRKDWSDFENAPSTTTIGFQLPILQRMTTTTIGGFLIEDKVGPFVRRGLTGTYTFKMRTRWFGNRDDVLTLGLGASINNFRFEPDKVIAFDGIEGDPNITNQSSNIFSPNVSFGAFYNSVSDFYSFKTHYYAGISFVNLIPTKFIDVPLGNASTRPQINIHGGYRYFPWRKKYFYEPSIMISYEGTKAINAMINMRYELVDNYWLSAGIVTNGEYFAQAGLIFTEDSFLNPLLNGGLLRMGFKFDYTLGSIKQVAGTGYEVYLAYIFERE